MGQKLLHDFLIEEHVKNSLKEDIGFGDITTDFLYNEDDKITALLNTREDTVVCGIDVLMAVYRILSDKVIVTVNHKDGEFVAKGTTIARI